MQTKIKCISRLATAKKPKGKCKIKNDAESLRGIMEKQPENKRFLKRPISRCKKAQTAA